MPRVLRPNLHLLAILFSAFAPPSEAMARHLDASDPVRIAAEAPKPIPEAISHARTWRATGGSRSRSQERNRREARRLGRHPANRRRG